MELLAPAGQWESMVAAVANGADAVYLGGTSFSARASAQNFTDDALRRAVEYCHVRGKKVYVTLNTLLLDKELQRALDYAAFLYESGVDAALIQDAGLASLLFSQLPGLELHASTQLGIHNLEGVMQAGRLGYKRVVLSREAPLEEVASIITQSDMEIEVFAHGAMCVAFSGGCLFSSLIGGRSGNRGACAQPCRLPYKLENMSGYLLSMRDLSILRSVELFKRAGVTSLKIEGRLKRPEYVALVTRAYRRAIDGEDITGLENELMRVFNRGGFSRGHYFKSTLVAPERPGNWGVKVATVLEASESAAKVQLSEQLHAGDIVELMDASSSLVINSDMQGEVTLRLAGAKVGEDVRLVSDYALLERARQSYANTENARVPVYARLTLSAGEKARLELTDACGHSVTVLGDVAEAAQKPPDEARIREQVAKLGDTPFELAGFEGELNAFLKIASLNALRREAADTLLAVITGAHARVSVTVPEILPIPGSDTVRVAARVRTLPQALAALSAGVDELQLAPEAYDSAFGARVKTLKPYLGHTKLLLYMPPLALHNDMHILETQLSSNRFDGAVCGSVSQLELIRDMPVKVADPLPGALNAHTVCALLDMGFNRVALSCELTKPQVRDIIKLRPCDLTVYGRTALMHMKHCPISASGGCRSDCASGRYTLSDRRGYVFPVSPVKLTSCLIRIMNSTPTDIITKLDGLRPATCVLDFSLEDASEVKARILALKAALAGENAQAAQGATGGHWNRGFTV